MAILAITIWILIIIGAFMLNPILGLIVLLSSIFMLGGGLDNKKRKAKVATKDKPRLVSVPKMTPEQQRESDRKSREYDALYGD